MRIDSLRRTEHLATLDIGTLHTAEQQPDVVPGLSLIHRLVEHFHPGTNRFNRRLQPDDFQLVADLADTLLDTTRGNRTTTLDREDVFDSHNHRLVGFTLRLGDIGIQRGEQFIDALRRFRIGSTSFEGRLRVAANDRNLIAREVVLVQQVANFHLDQRQQLFVVDQVALIEEHHETGHVHLASQEDVLTRLGHRTVSGRHHEDRAVHLGGTGDHILDIVGVAGTVDVGVVPTGRLVFDVRNGDRHRLRFVAHRTALGDIGIFLELGQTLVRLRGQQSRRRRRFPVVNVADRPHVDVRLGPHEDFLSHRYSLSTKNYPCE